jgi:RNA polymerase sigma factor (sigma-70 family)
MADDTFIGGVNDRFPVTHHSNLQGVRSPMEGERTRAYGRIVEAYWKPVYKYIRLKWSKSSEDAKDLTQGFFMQVMEKEFFHAYNPKKTKFRTFLRVCLDGYVANSEKAAGRLKRGGDARMISLDFQSADEEYHAFEAPSPETVEKFFDTEWARAVYSTALETLRQECVARGKELHFTLFSRYHLTDGTEGTTLSYDILASEFGLPVTTVTNHLAYARREFRRIVLDTLRALTASDEEFRQETRSLLGIKP